MAALAHPATNSAQPRDPPDARIAICMTEAIDFATVRFSTDDLPEEDRVPMWREHYGCTVLGVEIEPAEDALFQSSIVSRHLPGLNLVSGNLSAARVKRTREFVADGNDDVALLVNYTGAAAIAAGEREVVLRERDRKSVV